MLDYRPQRSWAKEIFSQACVKNSVHRGRGQGVCLSVCWDTTPPGSRHPREHTPPPRPGTPPPGSRPPGSRHPPPRPGIHTPPPQTRHTPHGSRHLFVILFTGGMVVSHKALRQTPPRPGTTPPKQTPPDQTHHPPRPDTPRNRHPPNQAHTLQTRHTPP